MRILRLFGLLVCCICFCPGCAFFTESVSGDALPLADSAASGLLASRLQYIDEAVKESIKAGELPGAVVLAARHGKIVYFKAFGNRVAGTASEPMTTDTIFDIASLTKVVATTPAIMQLAEKGKLRFGDKVKRYLPAFTGGGKENITVRQLLTHYSGLRPDFDLSREWSGYRAAMEELWKEKTVTEPGTAFAYSDLNFIALGEIVHAVTGQTLDVYSREHIFAPLGMRETCFLPPAAWVPRIAPTEYRKNTLGYLKGQATNPASGKMLRGEVHDPTAGRMGGVAGHAGLFSDAGNLAIYAQTLLNQGIAPGKKESAGGERILSAAAVSAMTRPQSPPAATQIRGYGWDIDSSYSSPRGDLFSGGYGHTGFSGTSMWIHPPTDSFIIILSNRLHPNGGKDISHLRGAIANIVASAIE